MNSALRSHDDEIEKAFVWYGNFSCWSLGANSGEKLLLGARSWAFEVGHLYLLVYL